jgi:hypothetical protein
MDVLLTYDILYGLRWGICFKPKWAKVFKDTALI